MDTSDADQFDVAWEPQPTQKAMIGCPVFEVFYGGARGGGKLSPVDSFILTPKGWRRFGDIEVGDAVSDPVTGGSSSVIAVYPHGMKPVWRLTFDDGASLEVGDEHLWSYRLANHHKPKAKLSSQREFARKELASDIVVSRWDNYRVGTTANMRSEFAAGHGIRIPLTEPVSFTVNGRTGTGDIQPYLVGLMLGDGSHSSLNMTACDDEVRDFLLNIGFSAHAVLHSDGKPKSFGAVGEIGRKLDLWLRNNGLRHSRSWEKFIPEFIQTAGIEYRLEVLRGLLDTDGTSDDRGRIYFISTSKSLSEGVQSLVRGLGGKASIRLRMTKYSHNGETKDGRPSWQVRIWHPCQSSLFKIARKKDRCVDGWSGGRYELTRELVNVEFVGEKETRCIRVSSPYGLYIADDFIVTHNSDAILGEWASHASEHGEHAMGLCVRRNRVQLIPLINRSKRIFGRLGARWHDQRKEWRWPNGALLRFAYLANDSDAEEYQGHSYSRVYVEEIGQFPDPGPILKLMATLRSGAGVPCGFRATGNPGGPGHVWCKARYISSARPWEIQRFEYENPWTNDKIVRDRVFIPSILRDNKYLGADYVANLQLTGSPQLVRAWLTGDWSIIEGAFFPEFSEHLHVIPSFAIPGHWTRFRAMDWGSAKPFSVGWYAVASEDYYVLRRPVGPSWSVGKPINLGETQPIADFVVIPKGAIVRYREWYGTSGNAQNGWNVGLKLDADKVAEKIIQLELEEPRGLDGRIGIQYGRIDPSANQVNGGPSIMERMNKRFVAAHTSPFGEADNRRSPHYGPMSGWDQLRQRLVGNGERPMIYFTQNCLHAIRTIPSLPHDEKKPEDADTEAEDHAVDEVRYACMSRPYVRTEDVKKAAKELGSATLDELFTANEQRHRAPQRRIT